jgi:hypothetical protein
VVVVEVEVVAGVDLVVVVVVVRGVVDLEVVKGVEFKLPVDFVVESPALPLLAPP